MRKQIYGSFLLLCTAFIWGSAFVAQRFGMDYIGPHTFNCIRSLLASAVLAPVAFAIRDRKDKMTRIEKKHTITGGLLCGVILFLGTSLQQMGIQYTTVQKASFISALYIVLIPIFGLFRKKKPRPLIWIAVTLSTLGLYLLCVQGNFSMNPGDALILLSAVLFAAHILAIDHFIAQADSVWMSCIQFFVVGILSAGCMLLFEAPHFGDIRLAAGSIVYTGILSSGIAYTLQIIAQKNTDPAVASLMLSLESVFGALAGWIILGESFGLREGAGMLFMFCAIILAQLPQKRKMTPIIQPDNVNV